MHKTKRVRVYECAYGVDDWCLYDKPGAKKAAQRITSSVNNNIKSGLRKLRKDTTKACNYHCGVLVAQDVQRRVQRVMCRLSAFGATDGETGEALAALLESVFKLEQYTLDKRT